MAGSPASHRPTVAISMGDPLGIGPEVIVKALSGDSGSGFRGGARFVIWGCEGPLERAAMVAGIAPFWVSVPSHSPEARGESDHGVVLVHDAHAEASIARHAGTPHASAEGGGASFHWVESCIAAARASHADAIVTGPISKEAWALAGHRAFPGHTELLAARFGCDRTRMMFVAPELMVILATTHIPLARVPESLSIDSVRETIVMGDHACRSMGIEAPRVAVCGLNPHAGEQGLIGEEDQRTIIPAIESARACGVDASGPWPGDTIFRRALDGGFDLVVAMYHDQGLIPVKLVAFDHAVNATIGLPVPRTSPDHGTAFDIAGRNMANPGSMAAAIALALDLVAAPISS